MVRKKSDGAWWLTLFLVLEGYSYQAQVFACNNAICIPKTLDEKSSSTSARIFDGVEAERHEFPSIVALCYKGDGVCGCGGTIISAEWVLTAAHCVEQSEVVNRLEARAGLHCQSEFNTSEDVQTRMTVECIMHEDYGIQNDIALLKISPPFEFNDFVKPADLPDASFRASGMLRAAGWGIQEDGGIISDELRKVDVPVVDDDICALDSPIPFDETHICAGHPEEGKNACPGDSGGPLYLINGDSQMVVGITSGGPTCGDPVPVHFTEVAYYMDWINEKTGQH